MTHFRIATRSRGWLRIAAGVVFAWSACSAPARGQELTIIQDFGNVTFGQPNSLMQARDGTFYGALFQQFSAFRMNSDGTNLQPLFGPPPCLEARDGVLYAAWAPGISRVKPDGSSTLVHVFDRATEGEALTCLVESRDGAFYGMARETVGGTGYGTIFRMLRDGTFTIIHRFDGTDGAHPTSALVEGPDGNLYGTSPDGGEFGAGTFFRITPPGVFTLLHSFTGASPEWNVTGAPLAVGRDGAIYGLTPGCLFRVALENPTIVQLPNCGFAIHSRWSSFLAASDGSFYVVSGSIYRITPEGVAVLFKELAEGTMALVHGRDGAFYGAAYLFGPHSRGYVFRVSNPSACEDTMHVDYNGGVLELRFTLKTTTPGLWGTWVRTATDTIVLWAAFVPSINPAIAFSVPLSTLPLPDLGIITFSSVLLNLELAGCLSQTVIDTSVGVDPP